MHVKEKVAKGENGCLESEKSVHDEAVGGDSNSPGSDGDENKEGIAGLLGCYSSSSDEEDNKKLKQSINISGESSKITIDIMLESDGESKMSSEGNNNITETALQRKKADRVARLRRWKETRLELSKN